MGTQASILVLIVATRPEVRFGPWLCGGVAEINPMTGAVIRVIDLKAIGACNNCSPTGLAAATNGQIMVGDGNTGGSGSIIFDPTTNKVIAVLPNLNGIDQVWYDPTTNRWFAAGSNAAGGPILAIVDATTNSILQIINTTPGDHSVAVDPISGEIFLPLAANAANTVCPSGCIGVFSNVTPAVPELSTWAMMLLGFAGLGFMFHRTKRQVSFA